jgi:anti-sigma factor (TIGR02949 family)
MTGHCGDDECRKLRELLSEYVDADLRDAVLRELDRHLEQCPDCHVHVDSVRKVIRLFREVSADAVPFDVRIRLRDVIRRAREGES